METDVLAKIPLFAELPERDRNGLAELLHRHSFEAGKHIVWVGEPGEEFFIIEQGTVMICLPDEGGRELALAALGPGQFFGEISLLDGGPRTATARAETAATLLKLGREDFLRFLHLHPAVAVHMLTVLGSRQRETNEKLRGIKNANEVIEENRTRAQRIAEGVARTFASSPFIMANLIIFAVWMLANIFLARMNRAFDDPPTFATLGFLITLEAILLSLFVLNSQNRQAERDRIRSDLEYQVNLKNHLEVMQLHQKVDRLDKALLTGVMGPAHSTGVPVPGGSGMVVP